MPTGVSSKSERPQCPRCGYDQTGLIESWKVSCPLVATCTECGYGFDPADAVYPTRKRLPWLYEHAKHWWSVRCAINTLGMLLWPPAFWRRVRPEHEVSLSRLLIWLVGALIVTACLHALAIVPLGLLEAFEMRRQWGAPTTAADAYQFFAASFRRDPMREVVGSMLRTSQFEVVFLWFWLVWLPMNLAFVLMPSEWRSGRILKRHALRVALYSATAAVFWLLVSFATIALPGIVRLGFELALNAEGPGGLASIQDDFEYDGFLAALVVLVGWSLVYWASAIRTGLALRPWLRPYLLVAATVLVPVPTVVFLVEVLGVYV